MAGALSLPNPNDYLAPAEPSFVQKLLLLETPPIATLPGAPVSDVTSVARQHGWVDGARVAGARGLLAGAAVGALAFWLVSRANR
jgi:hypothetical protein